MKKILETCLMIMAAYAFFGFVYPELCLMGDTCAAVEEGATGESENTKAGSITGKSENINIGSTAGKSEKMATGIFAGESREAGPDSAGQDFLREINSLPPEKIRIKSRLLKYLCKEN